MNEAIDYSTLRWVKQELDDTLNQARLALEAYVQNPDDQAQMSFCTAHLHQVFGTLQMVELYGASLLAEEMEQVAKALLEGEIRQQDDAYDVLMRSMLQLPDYLERLMQGGRDIPLVLLPLLNDLRAVRGENLLSENAMFSPDLSRPIPDDVRDYTGEDVRKLAKSLRHQYQVGLLAWYREQNTNEALQKLGTVLQQLQRASGSDAGARLWWLAGGLVAALREGVLEASLSAKLLMGQIDRQLKKLIDVGEPDFEKQLPTELQKNLLFYIARANGGGPDIQAIHKTYQLSSLLPDENEVTAAQESLSGHNLDLLQTVAVAVKENLGRIKDGLDLFQRGGCEQLESLQPVAETLKSLGDTLGMLGMGAPRKAILEKAELARDIIAGKYEANESTMMDIASALLFVEHSLDGMSGGRRVDAASAEDAEFDQVMVVVLQEAIGDMARAKDAITRFMEEQDADLLKEVPQLFNQVKGGLLLLGREKAAALVDAVGRYVARDMIEQRAEPDADTFDTLADAICGIEYYLEGQKEKRLFGASVIDVAVQAVARLGYPLPGELQEGSPDADLPAAPLVQTAGDAVLEAGEDQDEFSLENIELEDIDFSGEGESGVEEIDLGAVVEEETSPGNVVVTDRFGQGENPPSAQPDLQSVPVMGEDIDEEIMEIFIEEAGEEVATIGELLPRWLADNEDQEALITVRRSFHTLKGSGRLVGALLIGEFSWAFENLLNRVIDGTRELNDDMVAVFQQSLQALPQLVEQVKGGPAPDMDIALLQAQADALARTGSLDALRMPEVVPQPPEVAESAPLDELSPVEEILAPEAPEPGNTAASIMDPVLYEIFYSETETHLATMREFIAACRDKAEECRVSEGLVRALHTLHGSARMAEAENIAAIASGLERYVKILMAEQRPMPEEGLAVLGEGAELVSLLLARFKDAAPSSPDTTDLLARVSALCEASSGEQDETPSYPALVEMGLDFPRAGEEASEGGRPSNGEAAAAQAPTESVVDPEILEVFSEEVEEELQTLQACLPRWLDNQEDQEALVTARRSFHTLKGSGRLVGALAIGEFAWSVENLLNRVIEGTVASGEPLLKLMREVLDELPRLPEILHETVATPEMARLQERAEMLASGEMPAAEAMEVTAPHLEDEPEPVADEAKTEPDSEEELVAAVPEPVEEEVQEPELETAAAADDPYAEVDPELLSIFLEEADEILHHCETTLQEWLERPEDGGLMAQYQRHLHTLKGGARMADISAIGDLSHGLETMLTAVVEGQAPVGKRMFDLLQLAQDRLAGMVDMVHAHRVPEPATGLVAELESLLHDTAEDEGLQHVHLQVDEIGEPSAEVEAATGDPYAEADPELLGIFLEEGEEILQASEGTLHRWSEAPDNFDLMAQFQRELHTLKGGARMAGINLVGDLAHGVEALVTGYSDTRKIPPREVFNALHVAQDRLVSMVQHVQERKPIEAATGLIRELHALIPGAASQALAETGVERDVASSDALVADDRRTASRASQELVRVRADLLDNLVNYAGEISIYRARLEQQVGSYRFNLAEMEQTIVRLRQQLRHLEIETEAQILSGYQDEMDQYGADFDPLEMDRYSTLQQLSRSLAESVGDLSSIQSLLDNVTRESETLLLQQSRVNTELQEGLMRTRMVPFLGLAPRMRRIVRQTCQELNRQAELKLEGAEGEMDRTVIDRIIAPIEHMLRNALAHGIEAPEERLTAGKAADGVIRVSLSREASEVVIRIEDDGRGVDIDRVRAKAIERGLMRADLPLTDNEVLQFILETGFSTAQEVTQVSGRGVGMDVVNSEVKQLGGSLHIDSTPGKGTCFTIRLPFTLAINHALLVQVGEESYAIPLSSIGGIVRMRREDLIRHYNDPEARYEYAGYRYEVQHLGSLLGEGAPNLETLPARVPLLLARSGEHCVALHVDHLMGSREIVVKSVGRQISTVAGVSGATILGDGSVVLILDLAPLVRLGSLAQVVSVGPAEAAAANEEGVTVMVVDDSITVRKVTTRLLERNDMNVVSAKDGVDALAKLQELVPDVMLLDIEMPRMDGFELATHIRNDSRLRDIPIIMITSRTGEKHRNRAMEIGVNRYLGKPFVEAELLENIGALLAETRQHG
jgi:chemosensory pili system protein ChpA (sensor histidine kinase/response regulator)